MTKKSKEQKPIPRMPADYIAKFRQDFILFRANELLKDVNGDPQRRYDAVNELTRLINFKKEKATQAMYVDEITRAHNIGKQVFKDELKQVAVAVKTKEQEYEIVIPKGASKEDWLRYGFYEDGNAYYFRIKEGKLKLTNFTMKPIFHIDSSNVNDSMRIYELINEDGYRIVLDFDMNEMTSVTAFKRKMESRGNFLFWGTETQINQLKQKLYKETTTCTEVKNLGWQKEGYWAWSNGISTDTGFKPVDDYGRIDFSNQNYYIPAFSRIYIKDKSVFLDERKFRYIETEISTTEWAQKLISVFGDNAKIGIAFYLAAIFRDHMLHMFKNFPLLNLFGPKGTGKSQMAVSLACMFGIQQTPFNIHNGTKAGLAEHIQQFCNSLAWIDEYKNNIEYEKIETLKSIYDAIGRNRLNFENRRKKETTQVNSAVILSGQEMPTADVALFSRVVFCQFNKDQYNTEEKQRYDDLKGIEGKGLSHITAEIIQYRKEFVRLFIDYYNRTLAEFTDECDGKNIEDRIMRSIVMITATFRTLIESDIALDFGFDYAEMKRIGLKSIFDQQSQMKSSNEVSVFWHGIDAMASTNDLIEGWEYKLDHKTSLTLRSGEREWPEGKNILRLRFGLAASKFRKYAKSSGIKSLPDGTLEYYLRNSPYYIDDSKGTKFKQVIRDPEEIRTQTQTTTCMCFDYDMLEKMTNINLSRESEATFNSDPIEKAPF